MPKLLTNRSSIFVIAGAALMLTMAMGIRQSLGIFVQPITRDLALTVSEFTLAIAIQNVVWGVLQPFTGALVVSLGFRPVMLAGGFLYVAALALLAHANGLISVVVAAGVMIGAALACNASAIANAVAARSVPDHLRSTVLGLVTAMGSIGAMIAAPIGQYLSEGFGWRTAAIGFCVLAAAIVPGAWLAGRADSFPLRSNTGNAEDKTVRSALSKAAKNPSFVVMTCAYCVCGMQLVFITTHLPSYLALCGMDPMLSAKALGCIGGFNILGSLFFGWAGGRWNKLALLGSIYFVRSLTIGWYFILPPTPERTLVFASLAGFLWLGVGPLVSGAVIEMFGLRWQAMIQGVAFSSHQLGSFLGAFGGGILFDVSGSYSLAWRLGVGMGLAGGLIQISFALLRPTAAQSAKPPIREPAGVG